MSKKVSLISLSVTLAITAKAKQMKADGIDVVGFGAGEPDKVEKRIGQLMNIIITGGNGGGYRYPRIFNLHS